MTNLGKYEILEEIGRGGFAVVYKARDTTLDRVVALKVLDLYWAKDPSFVTRFRQEARGAARLRHPNIITVYEAGEAEGQLFIAMEYVPGRTLQELLEREGALPLERTSSILEQVADALDYAHQQGVIHRDVKPANIMVEDTEHGQRATLMDFGLVKAMAGSTALTSMGTLLGSPEYMAPEQADPERAAEVGPAADRYALGIVAYQMLTGRVPFIGNTPATLNAHEHKPVPHPRSLRPELSERAVAALLKMLAKAPGDRYPTATAFVAALRRVLPSEKEPRQPPPIWAWAAGAGLVAIALIVFLLVLNRGGGEDVKPTDTPAAAAAAISTPTYTPTPQPLAKVDESAKPSDTPAPILDIGSTIERARDGAEMVYVPGGTFEMGSTEAEIDAAFEQCVRDLGSECQRAWFEGESPQHTVTLDAFWIDKYEVTNAQYRQCVEDGDCEEPGCWDDSDFNTPDQPAVCVSWYDAQAYCEWAGGRLPTEAEWEYAARGPQGNTYPWGEDELDCDKANYSGCVGETTAVGSYPGGTSWCKALDMAGNVWEWVNDWAGAYPSTAQTNPTGPETGGARVLRGGAWDYSASFVRSADRGGDYPVNTNFYNGFRCVGASTSISP